MKLKKIIIENFKGIKKVELGPIQPINVLIGKNNSGKSSVLDALYYLGQCWTDEGKVNNRNIISEEFFPLPQNNTSITITVWVSATTDELEFANNKKPSYYFQEIGFEFVASRPTRLLKLTRVSADIRDLNFTLAQTPEKEVRTAQFHVIRSEDIYDPSGQLKSVDELKKIRILDQNLVMDETFTHSIARNDTQPTKHEIRPYYEYISKLFTNAGIVPPVRSSDPTGYIGRDVALEPKGTNLVSRLTYLNMDNYYQFTRVIELAKKIYPELGRLHHRHYKKSEAIGMAKGPMGSIMGGPGPIELAYEWGEGEIIKLVNMGGGVEQLLILSCLLMDCKSKCMLWEEPETHLHPGAQEMLVDWVTEKIDDNILFLTSHSPVFLKLHPKIAIHALANQGGKDTTGRTLSENELNEAALLIGARPGHLLQADIVVYVEGKRGAEVVEEWLTKWPERDKVLKNLLCMVHSINAEDLSGDYDITVLKKISPNLIIFVDKDNDPDSTNPKSSRVNLQGKCTKASIPFVMTKERQIEDYIPKGIIESVLEDKSPQALSVWREGNKKNKGMKRFSREFAKKMKWSDIREHEDIMKLFEEIAAYANKLTP